MKRTMMAAMAAALVLTACASAAQRPEAKPLTAADVRVEGMTITFAGTGRKVEIAPLKVTERTATVQLKVLTPSWRDGAGLPQTGWIYRMVKKHSLTLTPADRPEVKLVEGVDYLIDWDWARLGAVAGSKIEPGTKLTAKYQYTNSRLDLVQQGPDGAYSVVQGKEDRSQPALPKAAAGHRAMMSVYLPPNTEKLTLANLNFIDPAATGVPPVTGREFLTPVLAKLAAGEPVTVVFFGDSITAQRPRDFRDGKGSFVDRFATYMRNRYPDREAIETTPAKYAPLTAGQIAVVKAGRGGGDTPRALPRLKGEVLSVKPDLVVILFGANDENRRGTTKANMVPVPKYEANLVNMVRQIRAAGSAVILMTPAMKNLGWSATVGNMDRYAAAVRRVGASQKVCVVDNFKAWEDLPKIGYNYMIYLGTCINHPVDLGHEMFFEGLKAAMEDGG